MRYNILIVEDEPAIASAEKRILEKDIHDIDIHIDIVDNETDAIKALDYAADPYDLVISDLNLYDGATKPKDSSGLKLLKIISKRPNRPEVMIRSATPAAEIAEFCLDIGLRGYVATNHFIAKTGWNEHDRKELTSRVQELIKQKSKGRTLSYGRLTYDYDAGKWFCGGEPMMQLVFPYDKLLLLLVENSPDILYADAIFFELEIMGANYEKLDSEMDNISKKVSYRVSRLRKILSQYDCGEKDVICSSKRGGYFAKYIKRQ